ncbi:SPOR domain-containing protein [Longimonas halophila]|nr:SPOR domain-containing protein [Longimonas halophila]
MSDRLLSQLADRLGLDESDVAPMLNALLKQVRQRAGQGSRARIPTLGTFTTDANGTLQFAPDDDLVDAVNEDFAGLEDEPVPTPKRAPDTSTSLAEVPPAPSSSKESAADRASAMPTSDSSATEQKAEDAASSSFSSDDDDATEELPASDPASSTSSDTGSLWPSEANAPTSPDTAETTAETDPDGDVDDDVDDDFWSRDREWDLSSVAFGDVNDPDPETDEDAASASAPPASSFTSSHAEDVPTDSEDRSQEDGEAVPSPDVPPQDAAHNQATKRSGLRTTIGVFVVLAALIGGWIVLGAQGTVPSPRSVIENVRTSFSGDADVPEVTPSDSDPSLASDPSSEASDPSAPDESATDATDEPTAEESADNSAGDPSADTDTPSTAEAPTTNDTPSTAPIAPEEGGWTLVVASRTSEQEAEAIRAQFATALQSAGVPVDILPSEGGDGTTRYRVIVGQFSSQDAARRLQQEYSELVPGDAWPLRL